MMLICADIHANEKQHYENEYLELSVVIDGRTALYECSKTIVKHKAIILQLMPIIINDAIMAFIQLVMRAIF